MRPFVTLIERLDQCRGTGERLEALVTYFGVADPADAAWALQVLLAKRRRRLITGRRLRQICLEGSPLPEWLWEACYAHVGDSAETIALLWPGDGALASEPPTSSAAALPLHQWMEQLLPAAVALDGDAQAQAVRGLWQGLDPPQLLVANKLLTGGLRVGVAQGLVVRALARLSGLEETLLQHRLMGEFTASAASWNALLAAAEEGQAVASRPYPFFLASPLELDAGAGQPLPDAASAWLAEWKWDGIRGQLIHRAGEAYLWSRGEELIGESFPELIRAAASLPGGSVLDGEILVWPRDAAQPAAFAQLQRRLGRRGPGQQLLRQCPAVFMAYDLLEQGGVDIRSWPLHQRRAALCDLLTATRETPDSSAAGILQLSPQLPLERWTDLEPLRQQASSAGAEGLMLKALDSPYRSGRRRGQWWKHKRDPYTLDAVLLYAQAGSGRRANLFTDYTFALWNGDGELVTFAKAYSGLDDGEILELDRWIRSHTLERFGPVRAVQPLQVFELAFEGLQASGRHKSGIAVRFPRISRWRRDKPAAEADTLAAAMALLEGGRPATAEERP
ncbi:MAG: ATP-dependent DNA ligase [Synechococcus sp. ELA057]